MEKQMKTQSSGLRYTLVKFIMVWVLLVNSLGILQAQGLSKSPSAEIKYIGIVDDKLVFEIAYNSDGQNVFSVEIKDEAGYQFYYGKFKQKSFRKQFAIDKAELNNSSISFELSSLGSVKKEVFDINASARIVEEVSVVKL